MKMFILWDPKDGEPPRNEDGSYLTSGCIGVIPADNVYFRAYAVYPGRKRPGDLEHVGDRICGVKYSLSGEKGVYDIHRVE